MSSLYLTEHGATFLNQLPTWYDVYMLAEYYLPASNVDPLEDFPLHFPSVIASAILILVSLLLLLVG